MAAAADKDVKPDISKLHITVSFNQKKLIFLYKKTKPLEKLLIMFCEKMNLERKSIRFEYDGSNVRGGDVTAEELDMEDGDEVIGHIFQEGGF